MPSATHAIPHDGPKSPTGSRLAQGGASTAGMIELDAAMVAERGVLGMATVVAERAAMGRPVCGLELAVGRVPVGDGLAAAIAWAAERDLAVRVRARQTLAKAGMEALARAQGTLVLEAAHADPRVQAALLDGAQPVARLLLSAQHALAIGIAVVARVSPALVGLHGTGEGEAARALLTHVAAARVREVELAVGWLDGTLVRRLRRVVDDATLEALSHAYGCEADVLLGHDAAIEARRPSAGSLRLFIAGVRDIVWGLGLTLRPAADASRTWPAPTSRDRSASPRDSQQGSLQTRLALPGVGPVRASAGPRPRSDKSAGVASRAS